MVNILISAMHWLMEKVNNSLGHLTRMQGRHAWKQFLIYIITGVIAFSFLAMYLSANGTPTRSYSTSWIGNSFGGSNNKWVQLQVNAIHVTPDGTVYANSTWDEAGREAGIYKDGDVIGMAAETHGWGRGGGTAVTANGKYMYMAMVQGNEGGGLTGKDYPPKGVDWYCVRRYLLNGKPAPFPGGVGDGSILVVNQEDGVKGLAVAGNELYVSDYAANQIRVYDAEKMTELRHWVVKRPQHLAVDPQGSLWIIQAGVQQQPQQILHYSKTGEKLPQEITDVVQPTAIAVDKQGKLLVAENGPRQQVLIYNVKDKPKLEDTFGTKGGIYAGKPGEIGDLKFYGLTGVGSDAAGNIYVSCNGFKEKVEGMDFSGTDLRKLSPKGKLQWRLLGLQFVDNADADAATDGLDVFTKHEHFVMDYSQPAGKEWTYKAYTLDRFRYPDDPRLYNYKHSAASVFVRRLAGKRFLYLTGMYSDSLTVYRFDGEIAVPCAIVAGLELRFPNTDYLKNQPKGAWIWRDRNGDGRIANNEFETVGDKDTDLWGWEIDSKGDIWQARESKFIRRYRFQGLDTYGSPIYTAAAVEQTPMPKILQSLERLKYFPETDVMYLTGYTQERPQMGDEWGIVGTEILRYDNWSKDKKLRWRIPLPYNPKAKPEVFIKAMDIAGDRVFAADVKKAEVYVYDAATGRAVTKLKPGSEVGGESGWVDTPYGLRAFRRRNGEYLVFVEEDAKAKVIMYRLPA